MSTPARIYDLENRTLAFAKNVRTFVKLITLTIVNTEDIRQLLRSSGAVGANYIEANQNLGRRDFLMRVKIARKEAKESHFWLRTIDTGDSKILEEKLRELADEAYALTCIFGAMVRNVENRVKG